jgi:hypothetical protein
MAVLIRMSNDPKHREAKRRPKTDEKLPPAGAHAKPELIDSEKTPGSGVMPEPDQKDVEAPSG